ncbi:right-handed parallel beta-helix repeat-containing protein [Noviherbaspirillum galbum]|uniref:Right-handed parallel beta-helix repeat-containing protein n=1 Tax=Noviherbaspirillum galbum TaxID=2709383 RepID=A0A6B3SU39_9BURK|nr:right-handed parallel beta-helix repeat-containing protein [Noviherbaspirillum galbum]NEX64111.1 right-handed parallel beta-helix repeat-containing protein [Noviherbaspirillum galbum]
MRVAVVLGGLLALVLVCVAAFVLVTSRLPVGPRLLGPVLEQRMSGHHPMLERVGVFLHRMMESVDERLGGGFATENWTLGAQQGKELPASGTRREVSGTEQLRQAMDTAQPGDDIVLLPGSYVIASSLNASRPGLPERPITVRAERLHDARFEVRVEEGVLVSAPHWRFLNLEMRGACEPQAACEHAFHVAGDARHFMLANSVLEDFNAHVKVNGAGGRFPDHGLIDSNTLRNRQPRQTDGAVTPIDLVAASHWRVQGNLIANFIKAGGDMVSYGIFAKGAGDRNRIDRNLILCETGAEPSGGRRIGLSFGGGGTAPAYCRDGRCLTEQEQSSMAANLVARCSDAGIYVNRAAGIRLQHNTLLDTAGIQVRFPESAVYLTGNLVDGAIVSRDDGIVHAADNIETHMPQLYAGLHPVRQLFADAGAADLSWRSRPRERAADGIPDLCVNGEDKARDGGMRVIGAFNDVAGCLKSPRPPQGTRPD